MTGGLPGCSFSGGRRRAAVRLLAWLVPVLSALELVPGAWAHGNHPANQQGTPTVLDGVLSIWHGDVDPAPVEQGVVLDVGGQVIDVHMDVAVAARSAGQKVRIAGRLQGGVLFPDAAGGLTVLGNATPAPGAGATTSAGAGGTAGAAVSKTVAVILVNFTDNTSQPWTPASVEETILDADGSNPTSVRAYYEESSDDTVTLSGAVFGWYQIAYTDDVCDYRGWAAAAKAAASANALAAGIDLNSSSVYKIYAFPNTQGCSWAGLGELPGDESWIDGAMTLRVVSHELGHNFGAHHASTLSCRDATSACLFVTARTADDCTMSEYGDPFAIMGAASTRTHHAWHRSQIGYPVGVQTIVPASGYDATHTITALEPFVSAGATRLLRIQRGIPAPTSISTSAALSRRSTGSSSPTLP